MTKPEIVRAWCQERVGCPYIYGGTGQPCTPAYRQARAAQYPDKAEKIKKNCPRMMGQATTCVDCRWCDPETGVGKLAYDCAQLSRGAMAAVGISLVSGANSQWHQTAWAERGPIADMPRSKVCLVFRDDGDKMGHVGIYTGDGYVVHAKGHDYGVVRERLEDTKFTHAGIPEGLYDGKPARPILRQGSSGPDVEYLQTLLCDVGTPIETDGKFGPATAAAVRVFQAAHGLKTDCVVGPATWAALEAATGHDSEPVPAPDPAEPDDEDIPADAVLLPKSAWAELKTACASIAGIIKKYDAVG
jgi:cell wall-associated NlpC family hydrolase